MDNATELATELAEAALLAGDLKEEALWRSVASAPRRAAELRRIGKLHLLRQQSVQEMERRRLWPTLDVEAMP